jgi:uncharacterized protein RhaS with RHS repeats
MKTAGRRIGASQPYYRARYYDPASGRFESEDPLRFDGGSGFYRYVRNVPVDSIDPLGLLTCTTKVMLVTAYSDTTPGKDWPYFKHLGKGAGPGIVAVANTSPQPYGMGCDVTVSGSLVDPIFDPHPRDPFHTPAYMGQVHDTGAGWDNRKQHHHVQPDDWIDIWMPLDQARKWGVRWRKVTICCKDCGDDK